MFETSDATLASVQGGGFFTPVKFIAKKGGDALQMTVMSGPNGRQVSSGIRGVEVIDRPKQIVRVVGTAVAAGGVVAGSTALVSGQGAEGQTPSIEQLTGLE